MNAGDWLTVGVAGFLVGVLIYWRIQDVRRKRSAPPPQHKPSTGPIQGPDKEKLINIGTVGADGSNSH